MIDEYYNIILIIEKKFKYQYPFYLNQTFDI